MKYGGEIAKTKQRCRTIVYIALILLLITTYLKSNFASKEESQDGDAIHDVYSKFILDIFNGEAKF